MSYLHRLGVANQLQPGDLRRHLTGTRHHVPVTVDDLAAVTGRPAQHLLRALPELRPGTTPEAGPVLPAHLPRPVCRRCATRRGVFGIATSWQPAEVNLCPVHTTWLGPPARSHCDDQHDLRGLPEIAQAQRRHYRLARRHGRQAAAGAFAEAAHITALWARHGFYRDRRTPLIHALRGHTPLTGRLQSGDPLTPVVTYPETVDLARVLAMPRWRHPTALADDEVHRFRRDVNRHVGIQYHPEDSPYDPLFRWFQKHHDPHATTKI
jgi:hypothetical protein